MFFPFRVGPFSEGSQTFLTKLLPHESISVHLKCRSMACSDKGAYMLKGMVVNMSGPRMPARTTIMLWFVRSEQNTNVNLKLLVSLSTHTRQYTSSDRFRSGMTHTFVFDSYNVKQSMT